MNTEADIDRVFAALADATRRDIVRRAIAGEEGVGELADHHPDRRHPRRGRGRPA
jgi:DNA-binding transcriptional ArsR family regulator